MSRVTEAMYMMNCSSKEWSRFSQKRNGEYFYPFECNRDELQNLRNKHRIRNIK